MGTVTAASSAAASCPLASSPSVEELSTLGLLPPPSAASSARSDFSGGWCEEEVAPSEVAVASERGGVKPEALIVL